MVQARSQCFSSSRSLDAPGDGRREPWERGCMMVQVSVVLIRTIGDSD